MFSAAGKKEAEDRPAVQTGSGSGGSAPASASAGRKRAHASLEEKDSVKKPNTEAEPDYAANYARLGVAFEAARRKLAGRVERQAFFRAKWHKARKDGRPDEEAEALLVGWIAADTDQKNAQKAYEAALAEFRNAPLGPVPEYGPDNTGGRWAVPAGVAPPGPSTIDGYGNPHVYLFWEVVNDNIKKRYLRVLKPKHPGGRYYIVAWGEGDGGRGTDNDVWALETRDPDRLEERSIRLKSIVTDPLWIVMNSTGKYYAGNALCILHDGPHLPKDQLRTHISVPHEPVKR